MRDGDGGGDGEECEDARGAGKIVVDVGEETPAGLEVTDQRSLRLRQVKKKTVPNAVPTPRASSSRVLHQGYRRQDKGAYAHQGKGKGTFYDHGKGAYDHSTVAIRQGSSI